MTIKIPCPKDKAIDLFEALYHPGEFYKTLGRTENENVENKIRKIFPHLLEMQLERLIKEAKAEALRLKGTDALIREYAGLCGSLKPEKLTGNVIMDASYVISSHVEKCRGSKKCLDSYCLWVERQAEIMILTGGYNSQRVPQFMKRVDFAVLDIGISN